MTFQQVKEDISNYYINKATIDELLEKSEVSTKMVSTYSDMPKSKNNTSDSVCGEVFRRLVLEVRIKKINEKLVYIDNAMAVLDESERQVIEYIKKGYKMSQIAVRMGYTRGQVVYLRNKSIDKILKYTNEKGKLCTPKHFK